MKNWKICFSLCLIVLVTACTPTAAAAPTLPPTLRAEAAPTILLPAQTSTIAPTAVPTSTPTIANPTTPPLKPSPQTATSVPTLNPVLPTSTAVQAAKPAVISISSYTFRPGTLRVKVGTKVTWTNQDSEDHTVTGSDGTWGSDSLGKGDSYSFTFTKAGSFAYSCDFHPGMDGKVEVEP